MPQKLCPCDNMFAHRTTLYFDRNSIQIRTLQRMYECLNRKRVNMGWSAWSVAMRFTFWSSTLALRWCKPFCSHSFVIAETVLLFLLLIALHCKIVQSLCPLLSYCFRFYFQFAQTFFVDCSFVVLFFRKEMVAYDRLVLNFRLLFHSSPRWSYTHPQADSEHKFLLTFWLMIRRLTLTRWNCLFTCMRCADGDERRSR